MQQKAIKNNGDQQSTPLEVCMTAGILKIAEASLGSTGKV